MTLCSIDFNWTIDITDILTTVLSIGISVLIVVWGWNKDKKNERERMILEQERNRQQAALEQKLNRENEIKKELRNHRLKLLIDLDNLKNSTLDYNHSTGEFSQGKTEFYNLYNKEHIGFLCFGSMEEIESYLYIDRNCNYLVDKAKGEAFIIEMEKLKMLLINNTREELNLKTLS